ncbi:hypothetical protein [Paenibacillus sp. NPDC093718]|uniref:hypothetical protein n=1 Tax=Paenibacillus sp. NPDC093718 TaxID=3390601 RepID=UPI003D03D00B
MNIYEVHKKTKWKYERIKLLIDQGYLKLDKDQSILESSVDDMIEYLDMIRREYITFRDCLINVLGLNKSLDLNLLNREVRNLLEVLELPFCVNHHRTFVHKSKVKSYIELILSSEFILLDDASKNNKYIKNDTRLVALNKDINVYPLKGNKYLRISEIDTFMNKITNKVQKRSVVIKEQSVEITPIVNDKGSITFRHEDTEYINTIGIQEIFNSTYERTREAIKRGIFGPRVKWGRTWFVEKSLVNQAYQTAINIDSEYYTRAETNERLGYRNVQSTTLNSSIRRITSPCSVWLLGKVATQSSPLYLKKDVDQFVLKLSGPADPHNKLLSGLKFVDLLPETEKLFQEFCEKQISQSNRNKDSIFKMIEELLKLARIMEMQKKEYHICSNDEIDSLLKSIPKKLYKYKLYQFLKYIHNQRICKFKIEKIKNPKPKGVYQTEGDIYSFDELIDIYNHATNINQHIRASVENYNYAGTWLFILLHLSNAWRKADVVKIPKVYPEDIGVNKMDYFSSGRMLTLEQGQVIINQLKSFQLRVSKTNVMRNFFCTIDLVIPLATAMCINEFHRRNNNNISNFLLNFNNKSLCPSTTHLSTFFNSSEKLIDFIFGNRKMNRSLMTHLYYSIQKEQGEGYSAFILTAKLRNHVSDITKRYVSKTNEFGEITRAIFNRGEFGYLYDALLNIVAENKPTFIEQSEEIHNMQAIISPKFLETIVGFIQTIENENLSIISPINKVFNLDKLIELDDDRKVVLDYINRLTPSEAFQLIRKIYLRQLPSKEKHIQCFTYPSCFRESNYFDCKSCKYSIPNYMAVGAIINEFKFRIDYIRSAKTLGSKNKAKNLILSIMPSISYAIQTFGEEMVWSFMEGGYQEFEDSLLSI